MVQPIEAGPGAFWTGRGNGEANGAKSGDSATPTPPRLRLVTAEDFQEEWRGKREAAAKAAAARAERNASIEAAIAASGKLLRRNAKTVFTAAMAAALILFVASLAVRVVQSGRIFVAAPAPAAAPMTIARTVEPGDSLWSLAKRYGNPRAYVLDRVDALAQANGLSSDARLIPGQRILVPVSNPVEVARLRRNVATAAR